MHSERDNTALTADICLGELSEKNFEYLYEVEPFGSSSEEVF